MVGKKSATLELSMAEQLEGSKKIIRQTGKALSGAEKKIWPLMEIPSIGTKLEGKL